MPTLQLWYPFALSGRLAAPFSGGMLDAWPAWLVDAFAICETEVKVIEAFLRGERNG